MRHLPMVLGTALLLLVPPAAPLLAQATPTARPDRVRLDASGDRVEVTLSGEKIAAWESVRVLDRAGREARGIRARLGAARDPRRPLLLEVSGAAAGRYAVELVQRGRGTRLPMEVVVEAANRPPVIQDARAPGSATPGDPIRVEVAATDDGNVAELVAEWPDGRAVERTRGAEVRAAVVVPGLPAGTHQIRVVAVDDAGVRSTPVEVSVEVSGMADLAVVDFVAPSELLVDQPVGQVAPVTVRVRNDGTAAVPAGTSIPVGFYISPDPTITPDDRLLQGGRENLNSALTSDLQPGAEVEITLLSAAKVSSTFPDASPPTGSMYFGVLVDEFDTLEELDEANNQRSQPATVDVAMADLAVVHLVAPSELLLDQPVGQVAPVTVRVRNDGTAAVPAGTSIPVGFYISPDPDITPDDRLLQGGRENLNSALISDLQPGAEVEITLLSAAKVSSTFPDASPPTGSMYFGVLVDEFDALEELDEANNQRSQPATVQAAAPPG